MPSVDEAEYVVVGSGAGGGTVAARLAEAGHRVVVLEAGSDAVTADDPRLPADYRVPAFHSFASENPAMSWNFYVRHYTNEVQQRRDVKYLPDRGGVLYPRAGTLGGCTAHNAMILVRPDDSDWDAIADLTGDKSWRAPAMHRYWQRLENCHHRPLWRWLSRLGFNPTGHGWNGWLNTECTTAPEVLGDRRLVATLLDAVHAVLHRERRPLDGLWRLLEGQADPNDMRLTGSLSPSICYTPLTTKDHQRVGARERLLDVAARFPDRLHIELDALATKVVFDAENRAVGVDYLKGAQLYRASPQPSSATGEARQVRATREVILAGGAFNTPQLLMLSGLGPAATLAQHGIAVRVLAEGVGQNLQDRYEVGIVNRMTQAWPVLRGARFDSSDPLYREWAQHHRGMYTSNGAALAVSLGALPQTIRADLFCMALLARFTGYWPGYAHEVAAHQDYLTWAVLKAHTTNRSGGVTLMSNDARDPPAINFRYFNDDVDQADTDLQAVVSGIRFIRQLTQPLKEQGLLLEEELPGAAVQSDADLAQFVRDNAWGHHASCSCAIGPRADGGVLDSQFRPYGTRSLRVVDASVFPRIPGFFIASAVYMIAEKAADIILHEPA